MKRFTPLAVLGVLLLAGCTPAPNRADVIERAQAAIRKNGLEPRCVPIRGGTDGARLSFMGLPCPNLGTGGANCHGIYEYAAVEDMEKMVDILLDIVRA